MLFLRRSPAVLLFSALIFTSCSAPADNSSSANVEGNRVAAVAKKANDQPEELGMVINFTLQPEDIVWRQYDAEKKLVAVFRLDAEDTKKLGDELAATAPGSPYSVQVEDWFPPELVTQSETSGGAAIEGTAFPADMFYQDPYTKGVAVRINNSDFFVLELAARQTP